MRYRLAAAAASLALLVGCIAHEKEGDSASAVGDWKTAYVHYRDALTEKPDTPGLKPKFDNARVQALAQSRQQANNCVQQRDWQCVGNEAQFVLMVEPGAPDAAQLKAQAGFYQAFDVLQQARAAAAQRNFQQAADLVKRAREMSTAPEVAQEAGQVQMEIAAAAVAESDRLRQERKYDEAVAAMKVAIQYDPSQANRLRAVEQEREQWVAYQYERAAYDGDQAMAARDWRAAGDAYRAALQFHGGGRAEGLARYCDAMMRGQSAIANRQYDQAAQAYQEAVSTNLDHGEARHELEKLRVRPYSITIRSVLLVPTRTDGNPWTGPANGPYFQFATRMNQHLVSHAMERAIELASLVPGENRPEVRVEVMMPDGTRLATKPVAGLYATFEGDLIMATSGYDERHLLFRVMQRSANPEGEELGRMDVALRDLCDQGDIAMSSDSISLLRVTAKSADGRQEGTYAGLIRLGGPETIAPGTGGPGPAVAGAPPPPPPGGGHPPPPPGGTVVVTGGTAAPLPPPPATVKPVTYVPPPKPTTPPPAPPAVTGPPPKPPPVAPPMAVQPPPGAHGATAPPPPAGGAMAPPPPADQVAPAPPNGDEGRGGKGPRGKDKKHGKGRGLGHDKDD